MSFVADFEASTEPADWIEWLAEEEEWDRLDEQQQQEEEQSWKA